MYRAIDTCTGYDNMYQEVIMEHATFIFFFICFAITIGWAGGGEG